MLISDWSSDVCSSDLDAAMRRLEAILHPLVRAEAPAFLAKQARLRRPLAVLDIPLLFETGGEQLCDAVIVVTAPAAVQRARVLRRTGMTEAKMRSILARQLPDAEKRRRADFVVQTGLGRSEEHTSELQSLMRISYAVFCLKQNNTQNINNLLT